MSPESMTITNLQQRDENCRENPHELRWNSIKHRKHTDKRKNSINPSLHNQYLNALKKKAFGNVAGKGDNAKIHYFYKMFSILSESKECTRPLVLTRKNLVRASGLSVFV